MEYLEAILKATGDLAFEYSCPEDSVKIWRVMFNRTWNDRTIISSHWYGNEEEANQFVESIKASDNKHLISIREYILNLA